MTNTQSIITSLLSGYVDQYEIPEEAQSTIERIKERFAGSPDPKKDAESLYGAQDCDDVALGLLWVVERSASEADRTDPTEEEVQVVHTALTSTLSRMGLLHQEEAASEPVEQPIEPEVPDSEPPIEAVSESEEVIPQPEDASVTVEAPEESSVMVEETPQDFQEEVEEQPVYEEPVATTEEPSVEEEAVEAETDGAAEVPAGGTTDPAAIGKNLEDLLEALQGGEDTMEAHLVSLRSSFAALRAEDTADPTFLHYAEVVDDFLGYVQENDLLDDVRVMNFFTNVQEPYAQWMETPEGEREGILEQAIDFLTDFRAMFE